MQARAYGSDAWTVDKTALSIDQAIRFSQGLGLDAAVMIEIRKMYTKASRLGFGDSQSAALYEAINPRAAATNTTLP
jgi:hypothetical protein